MDPEQSLTLIGTQKTSITICFVAIPTRYSARIKARPVRLGAQVPDSIYTLAVPG
jgi:hypothetical protein